MEGNGYIKLHRQIMENEFYFAEKFTKAQAWIDLLLLANHKAKSVFIRGIEISLKSGDLCYSQVTLAKKWKWSDKTVKKYLEFLKSRKMIDFRGGRITTVISIMNWSKYQISTEQNQPIKSISDSTFFDSDSEQLTDKQELIKLTKLIVERIEKEKSFYSIIGKYINSLGADRLTKILENCKARGVIFSTEANLSAYLQVCSKNNGKVTESIPEIKVGVEEWMQ